MSLEANKANIRRVFVFRFSDSQVVEEWSAGWEWLASVPLLPAP
jgi:hypothetical protein